MTSRPIEILSTAEHKEDQSSVRFVPPVEKIRKFCIFENSKILKIFKFFKLCLNL